MRGWRDKPYTKGRECFTAWGARKASDEVAIELGLMA